jgi:hypothetical protein
LVSVQHLLLTRFSVRIQPSENPWAFTTDQELPRGWLDERLRLFRDYCMPSVRHQTCADFAWLVFCDRSTHPDVLEVLYQWADDTPQMLVALTDEFRSSAAGPHIDDAADVVVTTRLDSDDAIHQDYVAAIQGHIPKFAESAKDTLLVNFPRGYKLNEQTGDLFFHWETRSHFHSLLEKHPGAGVQTVLSHTHSSMHTLHPTLHDDTFPAWLEVIHGGNVSNKLYKTLAAAPETRLEPFNLAGDYAVL